MVKFQSPAFFVFLAVVGVLLAHRVAAITEVTMHTLEEQVDSAEAVVRGRIQRINVHTYGVATGESKLRSCGTTYSINVVTVFKGQIDSQFDFSTHSTPIGLFFRPVRVGDELLLLLEGEPAADGHIDQKVRANASGRSSDVDACLAELSRRRLAFDTEGAFLIQMESEQSDRNPLTWFHYQSNRTTLPSEISSVSEVSTEVAPEARGQLSTLRRVLWTRIEPLVRAFGNAMNDKCSSRA